jgi:hypothetical protein
MTYQEMPNTAQTAYAVTHLSVLEYSTFRKIERNIFEAKNKDDVFLAWDNNYKWFLSEKQAYIQLKKELEAELKKTELLIQFSK